MTSSPSSTLYEQDCPFCTISQEYPPVQPISAPKTLLPLAATASQQPDPTTTTTAVTAVTVTEPETAFTILSTHNVLAFLDHMPITRGHVLVTPRRHREKLSHCTTSEAAVLGAWLPVLSRAVMRAVGALAGGVQEGLPVEDWNVVQNNGARAAQVVKHVHYHIIPRPGEVPDLRARSWTMFGRGQRGDLDEEEALATRDRIRQEIRLEMELLSHADRRILGVVDTDEKARL